MAEKLTFKEDPAAADAFGFKEDAGAAAAFGARARDSQAAAESMRGAAKVERDAANTRYDLSSGAITTPKIPLINLTGEPEVDDTGERERRRQMSITDPGFHRPLPIADQTALEASNVELEKFNSGLRGIMGGAGVGSLLGAAPALAARGAAAPATAASEAIPAAEMTTAQLIKTAITHSTKELAKKAFGETGTAATGELAARAGRAAISAARAAVPTVAAAAPASAGPISNAVERLRGSAAGNPRAADLLSKIETPFSQRDLTQPAQPTFPAPVATGTVSQGTLGGSE